MTAPAANRAIKLQHGWNTGHPPQPGVYLRRYTERLQVREVWDGQNWRYENSGNLCALQSKPWRPVDAD